MRASVICFLKRHDFCGADPESLPLIRSCSGCVGAHGPRGKVLPPWGVGRESSPSCCCPARAAPPAPWYRRDTLSWDAGQHAFLLIMPNCSPVAPIYTPTSSALGFHQHRVGLGSAGFAKLVGVEWGLLRFSVCATKTTLSLQPQPTVPVPPPQLRTPVCPEACFPAASCHSGAPSLCSGHPGPDWQVRPRTPAPAVAWPRMTSAPPTHVPETLLKATSSE